MAFIFSQELGRNEFTNSYLSFLFLLRSPIHPIKHAISAVLPLEPGLVGSQRWSLTLPRLDAWPLPFLPPHTLPRLLRTLAPEHEPEAPAARRALPSASTPAFLLLAASSFGVSWNPCTCRLKHPTVLFVCAATAIHLMRNLISSHNH